ncbi:MAG: hypothetical protein ACRDOL_34190, partial [Streptosporangiaceae bacterium]
FSPSPGTVSGAVFPAGAGIRVDTHVQQGSEVPAQYDSLLAKLVAFGADRGEALARLRGALGRCEIGGVTTNVAMLAALVADAEFAAGGVDTGYLARWLAEPREWAGRAEEAGELAGRAEEAGELAGDGEEGDGRRG